MRVKCKDEKPAVSVPHHTHVHVHTCAHTSSLTVSRSGNDSPIHITQRLWRWVGEYGWAYRHGQATMSQETSGCGTNEEEVLLVLSLEEGRGEKN